MDPKIGGTIQDCANGGHNVSVYAAQGFGNEKFNTAVGAFASGSTQGGPVTKGAFAQANANGHGLSAQYTHTHGIGTTLSENARINLMQSGAHSLDANAFHSRTELQNGLNFDKVGSNVAWNHAQGHAASLGISQIPKFDMKTIDASAKANLWTSSGGASSLDLAGNAQRHLSGPFAGKDNFGANLGFTHRF